MLANAILAPSSFLTKGRGYCRCYCYKYTFRMLFIETSATGVNEQNQRAILNVFYVCLIQHTKFNK